MTILKSKYRGAGAAKPEPIQPLFASNQFPAVVAEPVPPMERTLAPAKVPKLLVHYWSLFTAPPFWWNRIRTHKDLMGYLAPEKKTIEVKTVAEILDNPGKRYKVEPEVVEVLEVEEVTSYPVEWDRPNPAGAVPTIKVQTFFEWQREHKSFSHMGIRSLKLSTA
jgi:hypothetical protein